MRIPRIRDYQGQRIHLIGIGGSSETTEIGDVPRLNEKGEMINDNWHTLDGRKLSGEPTKSGIYVRNGKKVIVNK